MSERAQLTQTILESKRRLGLTWQQIARELGDGSPVMYTAALLGQFSLTAEEASRAVVLLELNEKDITLLVEPPARGETASMPPNDPLIYRFYEILQNYGGAWKHLINEEFGDGIMSDIDLHMQIEREPDPAGDRVKLTISGKFLPYKRY